MAMREYRKGNWTVEETMILIEAKRKDDERRRLNRSKQTLQSLTSTTSPTSSSTSTSKPVTELRWKWVEEYCWGKGCFRSQNQCNDKWDNLMRDYKKVRDYQKSLSIKVYEEATATTTTMTTTTTITTMPNKNNNKSYWDMVKIERKDKGLPTNMLPQVYQALFDVVETTTTTSFSPLVPAPSLQLGPAPPPMLPPPPLPSPSPSPFSVAFLSPQPHPSPALLEAETSEQHSHDPELSPAKRRRKEEGGDASGVAATHTAAVATATATARATGAAAAAASTGSLQEVSTAICRSATILSEAIQASEEGQERRHREMMNLHESSLEMSRQGFNGLTDAINRLATSIFDWANCQKPQQQGP